MVALVLLALLSYLDLFVVKHYFGDAEVADYSRASLVARSFLYAPGALVAVLIPKVAAARARGEDTRPLLLRVFAVVSTLLVAGLAFVWLFTGFTITLLCGAGDRFHDLAPLVRWFCAAILPMAMFYPVLYYLLAARNRGALAIEAVAVVGYALALQVFHDRFADVIAGLAITGTVVLVAGLALALRAAPGPLPLPKPDAAGI